MAVYVQSFFFVRSLCIVSNHHNKHQQTKLLQIARHVCEVSIFRSSELKKISERLRVSQIQMLVSLDVPSIWPNYYN